MFKKIVQFGFSFIFMLSSAVAEDTSNRLAPVDLQKLGKRLTLTMLKCPERIWPNYTWKNYNVLIKIGDLSPVVWQGRSGELKDLKNSEIPATAFLGSFEVVQFEGRRAL